MNGLETKTSLMNVLSYVQIKDNLFVHSNSDRPTHSMSTRSSSLNFIPFSWRFFLILSVHVTDDVVS